MKRRTIDQFFASKSQKTSSEISAQTFQTDDEIATPSTSTGSNFSLSLPSCKSNQQQDQPLTLEPVHVNKLDLHSLDIGSICDQLYGSNANLTLDMELKHKVLKDGFVPNENFVFPVTEVGGKKRKFQIGWLKKWPWLAYSKANDGAYCKFCVIFGPEYGGKGGHQKMASLVVTPFKKWKDAIEKFTTHSQTEYHKFSSIATENFLSIESGSTEDVATLLDTQRAKERKTNREFLKPIVESIIFCGENEIPLRGHRDSGPLLLEKPQKKEGKFRALLRFRAGTDENLRQHVVNSARNATYISPDIQNQIIEICGDLIQKRIVENINNGICFAILCDETMDRSGKEQLSLCVRYISDDEKPTLKEDFLAFVQITDLTAENISKVILQLCQNLNLDMSKLIGQGYDGCSTFSGHITGVHQRLQELYPKAIYVHCASHKLNLVLSESLGLPLVRNCLGVMGETINLLRNNIQASDLLKKNISSFVPDSKKTRLIGLCETRFIERQDALNAFIELFPAIIPTLQELSQTNRQISTTASSLLAGIEKSGFMISMVTCEFLFSITLPLSKYLQKIDCDLSSALKHVDSVQEALKKLRTQPKEGTPKDVDSFSRLFERAKQLLKDNFDCEISVPRQTLHQTKRDNVPHSNPEEYYRRAIFIPCVDSFIANLDDRFGKNREILESFNSLLPRHTNPAKIRCLDKLELFYCDRASRVTLETEYILWCQKWQNVPDKDKPNNVMTTLDNCDKCFYPGLNYLLRVLASLPVSTAEVERSFSSLKRIKSYLRNSMENERLNGLALMSVHYPVSVTADEVLDNLARSGSRKIIL